MDQRTATRMAALLMVVTTAPSGAAEPREASVPLRSAEIRSALEGKLVYHDPPGGTDMDIYEEFHTGGAWGGVLMGRGPVRFSGSWTVRHSRLCVTADRGNFAEHWHIGQYCRTVWRNRRTGVLAMDYLGDLPGSPIIGRQTVTLRELPSIH